MSKIFDALRKAEKDHGPLQRDAPLSAPADAHPRNLRTHEREFGALASAVQGYFTKTTTGRVILVTGCVEREGASYVSAHLARTLAALSGEPVLYVDGNFHDPGMTSQFQAVDQFGLGDIFDNGRPRDITPLLQRSEPGNLFLLGTGQRRIAPAAFYDSAEFDALLDSLRRTFRYTIVDGPPLLRHPDAMHIGARVDGAILVVRYRHLKREVIRKGIEMMESSQGPILGAVLNRRKFAIPTLVYKLIG